MDLVRRYVNVVGGEAGLRRMFTLEKTVWLSEVSMAEEVMEEFRVELE